MSWLFAESMFQGDLSKWKLDSLKESYNMFSNSPITRENCTLDLSRFSEKQLSNMFKYYENIENSDRIPEIEIGYGD